MNKNDRMYFDTLVAAADCSCKAAQYLAECLSDYNPEHVKTMLVTMHEYEHAGDTQKHEMTNALAKAFVTPIDREDLDLVSQNIDEVTDKIEEVLQLFYMYRIQNLLPQAACFAAKIFEACQLMKEMLCEFVNFKHPAKLRQMVIDLNNKEEECDALYIDAIFALNDQSTDALEVISWRDIYNRLESCADACEHVGDCVDLVLMKNS